MSDYTKRFARLTEEDRDGNMDRERRGADPGHDFQLYVLPEGRENAVDNYEHESGYTTIDAAADEGRRMVKAGEAADWHVENNVGDVVMYSDGERTRHARESVGESERVQEVGRFGKLPSRGNYGKVLQVRDQIRKMEYDFPMPDASLPSEDAIMDEPGKFGRAIRSMLNRLTKLKAGIEAYNATDPYARPKPKDPAPDEPMESVTEAAGRVWVAVLNDVEGVSVTATGTSQSGAIRNAKAAYKRIHDANASKMGVSDMSGVSPTAEWAEMASAFDGFLFQMPVGGFVISSLESLGDQSMADWQTE